MSEDSGTNLGEGRRKDRLALLLLVVLIGSFGWSYYEISGNNKTIHDQTEDIVTLTTNLAGQEARSRRLQATIEKM